MQFDEYKEYKSTLNNQKISINFRFNKKVTTDDLKSALNHFTYEDPFFLFLLLKNTLYTTDTQMLQTTDKNLYQIFLDSFTLLLNTHLYEIIINDILTLSFTTPLCYSLKSALLEIFISNYSFLHIEEFTSLIETLSTTIKSSTFNEIINYQNDEPLMNAMLDTFLLTLSLIAKYLETRKILDLSITNHHLYSFSFSLYNEMLMLLNTSNFMEKDIVFIFINSFIINTFTEGTCINQIKDILLSHNLMIGEDSMIEIQYRIIYTMGCLSPKDFLYVLDLIFTTDCIIFMAKRKAHSLINRITNLFIITEQENNYKTYKGCKKNHNILTDEEKEAKDYETIKEFKEKLNLKLKQEISKETKNGENSEENEKTKEEIKEEIFQKNEKQFEIPLCIKSKLKNKNFTKKCIKTENIKEELLLCISSQNLFTIYRKAFFYISSLTKYKNLYSQNFLYFISLKPLPFHFPEINNFFLKLTTQTSPEYYANFLLKNEFSFPLYTFLNSLPPEYPLNFYYHVFKNLKKDNLPVTDTPFNNTLYIPTKTDFHILDFLNFFLEKRDKILIQLLNTLPYIPPYKPFYPVIYDVWIFILKHNFLKNMTFFFLKTPALVKMADSLQHPSSKLQIKIPFILKKTPKPPHLTFLTILYFSEKNKISNFNYTGVIEYITDDKTLRFLKEEVEELIEQIHLEEGVIERKFNFIDKEGLEALEREKGCYTVIKGNNTTTYNNTPINNPNITNTSDNTPINNPNITNTSDNTPITTTLINNTPVITFAFNNPLPMPFNLSYAYTLLSLGTNPSSYKTTLIISLKILKILLCKDNTLLYNIKLHIYFSEIFKTLKARNQFKDTEDVFISYLSFYKTILSEISGNSPIFYNYIVLFIADITLFGKDYLTLGFTSFKDLYSYVEITMKKIEDFSNEVCELRGVKDSRYVLEGVKYRFCNLKGVKDSRYVLEGVKDCRDVLEGVNNYKDIQQGVNNYKDEQQGVNNYKDIQLGVNNYKDIQQGVNNITNQQQGVNYSIDVTSDIFFLIDVVYLNLYNSNTLLSVIQLLKTLLATTFNYKTLYVLVRICNTLYLPKSIVLPYLKRVLRVDVDFKIDPVIFRKLSIETEGFFKFFFDNICVITGESITNNNTPYNNTSSLWYNRYSGYKGVNTSNRIIESITLDNWYSYYKRYPLNINLPMTNNKTPLITNIDFEASLKHTVNNNTLDDKDLTLIYNMYRRKGVISFIRNNSKIFNYLNYSIFVDNSMSVMDCITVIYRSLNREHIKIALEVLKTKQNIRFYIPQLIQVLRREEVRCDVFILLIHLSNNNILCHELLLNLKCNISEENGNKKNLRGVHTNKSNVFKKCMDDLILGIGEKEVLLYEKQVKFYKNLNSISFNARNEENKKEFINKELEKIEIGGVNEEVWDIKGVSYKDMLEGVKDMGSKEEGVNERGSKQQGVTYKDILEGVNDMVTKEEGVSYKDSSINGVNKEDMLEGVNKGDTKQRGVNNVPNIQQGVSIQGLYYCFGTEEIIDIVKGSGRVLQSHAKVPYMITLKCINKGGVSNDGVIKTPCSYIYKRLIVKAGDDCRQDMLALQLIQIFKDIFKKNNLDIFLYPYRVLCTDSECGLIEVVENAITRDQIGREKINSLVDYFELKFGFKEGERYSKALYNFVSSLVGYSLVVYFLNIKDRHNGNILIDDDGFMIHIDFGFMFETSPGNLSIELPLKLTAEIFMLMGGYDGVAFKFYREMMVKGFVALRRSSKEIMYAVDCFKESGLDCYRKGAVDNFYSRFMFDVGDNEIKENVEKMINGSCKKFRTWIYDKYQEVTNNIAF
ncbi:phosphatidylinositol-4- kinase [Hamiltosporidium tvaerminnensis]|nr:phosphatidylinositol-4- kinase [Hamiltosporidium tvaerminnensis]